ncbi:MAG: Ankyrin repeat domain-containing protein 44 [Chaenotheca gracillima]|nr:MAG: Ankyrin repeat domain-containing protein 44 [Chaenotheca gracillima]
MASQDGATLEDRTRPTEAPQAEAGASTGEPPKEMTKSALKKKAQLEMQEKKKAAKREQLAAEEQRQKETRQALLEEAKKVVITEDQDLPKARKIHIGEKDPNVIRLRKPDAQQSDDISDYRGTRVVVHGWVHRLRSQKGVVFITLQDGSGELQCVLTGTLIKTYQAMTLTRETSMAIYGEMWEVPPTQHAPDNRELHADYYEIDGVAPGDKEAIGTVLAPDADPHTYLNHRHLAIRGDTLTSVFKVRSTVLDAFRQAYREASPRFWEVDPPALVQTQVEGGGTLFSLKLQNGEVAYLTQTSQLYLETCLRSFGQVFTIQKSFRAEKSLTRRHLSEYTHVEGELSFISFDDLLAHLEHLMTRVVELTLEDPVIAGYIKTLNPGFQAPSRPFMRMRYAEAITWLNEHSIPNEDGNPHVFGDDIAEAAERKMTDIINRPIFLTHFPVEIKAFYMKKDKEDPRVTESVDVLMPGVGEIVGGSMRIRDHDELMAAFEREGINPKPYYWYTDQTKYGSCEHGGYGLGLERFLAWMCGQWTVRDTILYPRFMGRCTP